MYAPPLGSSCNFHFQVSGYAPPNGNHVNFAFGAGGGSGLPFSQFTVTVIT
jgi:hypothetical protein